MLIIPTFRFRRLRRTSALRDLVRETKLSIENLILPIFVEENIKLPVPIKSMPDVFRYPESMLGDVVRRAWKKGINAILLFGVSHNKDDEGSDTWNGHGLMARMIKIAKQA
jgi:porphobilinogen synthase